MKLNIPFAAPLDQHLFRGTNPSTLLRKDCASRFLWIATAESGFIHVLGKAQT